MEITTLVHSFRIQDFFDILLITFMIYGLLVWFRDAASRFVLVGIDILGRADRGSARAASRSRCRATRTTWARRSSLKQYPNLTGADVATNGARDERLYTAENPGLWLNPAGAVNGSLYQLGTAPPTLDDVRTPHRNNWDFVATKDIRLGGTARAQVRFEVLNITNTVKTAGPTTAVGSTTYGRITTQRGFMRLTQLMFRINF